MEYRYIRNKLCLIIIFSCFLLFACTDEKNTIKVYTDIEYVESQFPKIEDIQAVKYIYNVTSSQRDMIGPQNVEFCGFIKIGENFLEEIEKEYKWKETKRSRRKVPKSILIEGENIEYHFTYNYEFSMDGKYKTNSWGGDFYLDKEKSVLYFELER